MIHLLNSCHCFDPPLLNPIFVYVTFRDSRFIKKGRNVRDWNFLFREYVYIWERRNLWITKCRKIYFLPNSSEIIADFQFAHLSSNSSSFVLHSPEIRNKFAKFLCSKANGMFKNPPDRCISLCKNCKYSANCLFLEYFNKMIACLY